MARAAGDPDALRAAMEALSAVFGEVTGADPVRRSGRTYAGRGLVYEDTTRDVRVTVGGR
nr:hypothetical protein GCM10020093_102240 [Planobispora longispora]